MGRMGSLSMLCTGVRDVLQVYVGDLQSSRPQRTVTAEMQRCSIIGGSLRVIFLHQNLGVVRGYDRSERRSLSGLQHLPETHQP
jgi:hypothetical protein